MREHRASESMCYWAVTGTNLKYKERGQWKGKYIQGPRRVTVFLYDFAHASLSIYIWRRGVLQVWGITGSLMNPSVTNVAEGNRPGTTAWKKVIFLWPRSAAACYGRYPAIKTHTLGHLLWWQSPSMKREEKHQVPLTDIFRKFNHNWKV